MNQWNYSLTVPIVDPAFAGYPVEITRRGRESAVVISKSSYEAYKKAGFDTAYFKKSISNEKA